MFPIIPILAIAALVGGGATLAWYSSLSPAEQRKADRIACDYAQEIYSKTLKQLTEDEADHVHALTKRHFSA